RPERLHLVEAVLDRVRIGLVAEMPFAGEIGRVTVLLEELGDGRRLLAQMIFVTRSHDDRQRRTNGNPPGDERAASRRAARLAVPTRKHGPFLGDLVDMRGRVAERSTST